MAESPNDIFGKKIPGSDFVRGGKMICPSADKISRPPHLIRLRIPKQPFISAMLGFNPLADFHRSGEKEGQRA